MVINKMRGAITQNTLLSTINPPPSHFEINKGGDYVVFCLSKLDVR